MFNNCLILAGGSGTRLWPISNSKKPKQFLPIVKGKADTFFSQSLERAFQVVEKNSGKVIIIAGKTCLPFVISACSGLNIADKKRLVLIPEPEAKSTAPAIACALVYLRKTSGKNGSILVLTSDHIIKPIGTFKKDVKRALNFAVQNQLVVFGISPLRPETGYGYIKTGKTIAESVYSVDAFQEKPDKKTAERLVASKRFFWNSGMFAFGSEFMADEFNRHAGEVIRPFEKLCAPGKDAYTTIKGIKILDKWSGLAKAYHQTKSISIDYAVVEKCSRIVMVHAAFEWLDVGNWDEYVRLLPDNSAETYTAGMGDGCFVDSDIPVALVGVENLIVVIRSGKDGLSPVALIVKKGETQHVKDIVEQIKQTGRTDIL